MKKFKCKTNETNIKFFEKMNILPIPVYEAENPSAEAKNRMPEARNSIIGARNSTIGARKPIIEARSSIIGARNSSIGTRNPSIGARNSIIGARNSSIGTRNSIIEACTVLKLLDSFWVKNYIYLSSHKCNPDSNLHFYFYSVFRLQYCC